MKRTIKDIYNLICEKIRYAKSDKINMQNCINQSCKDIERDKYINKENRLIGEIDAYTDIKILLETSGVLDNDSEKILNTNK